MIEQLTPSFRYTCDRCGRVVLSNEEMPWLHQVAFTDLSRLIGRGEVCIECYNDFCEIAENFFDEVNKNG